MNTIFIKESGEYIRKDFSPIQLVDWFKENTDDNGEVQGDVKIYGTAEIKLEGEGFTWVLSDMTLDRDMERMDPTGWDVKEYRKNPIVLFGHDSWRPAIGLIKNLKKPSDEKGQLIGTVVFDESGTDPLALMVASKVRAGILSKGSVGFRVKMIEILEDQRDGTRLIHRKMELMEFSIVNIPANPSAQVQREAETGMPKTYINELLQDDKGQNVDTGKTSNSEGRETSASETSNLEGYDENASETSDLEDLFRYIPDEGKSTLQEILDG